MTDDIKAIRDALQAGPTPGPWLLATSNSWRRLVAESSHQAVCEPITQSDGHPDLHFRNGGADGPDARYIAACHPERIARLLDALELATKDAERYRWLRRFDHFATVDAMLNQIEFNTLDAAIDAAMKGQA